MIESIIFMCYRTHDERFGSIQINYYCPYFTGILYLQTLIEQIMNKEVTHFDLRQCVKAKSLPKQSEVKSVNVLRIHRVQVVSKLNSLPLGVGQMCIFMRERQ